MRALSVVVALLVFFTGFASAQAPFPFTAEVTADRTNIRAGQHNNFESLAVLAKGDRVTVLAKQYSWYRVALPPGAQAWVKAEYVRPLPGDIGEVIADKLNVRAAPDADSSSLGRIERGRKFFVVGEERGWYKTGQPLEGVSGWVHDSLLVYRAAGAMPAPSDAAIAVARRDAEEKIRKDREAAKTALLTALPGGRVECAGTLQKREGGPSPWRVARDHAVVCFVEGPQQALDAFMNARVRVMGRVTASPEGAPAAVVSLDKIRMDF